MSLFNMNIQEMESSGELNKLRTEWFGSPTECDELDYPGSESKFPVDDFYPLTILAVAVIGVAVLLATINRILWGPKVTRKQFQESWKNITARKRRPVREETIAMPGPNLADKNQIVHVIEGKF